MYLKREKPFHEDRVSGKKLMTKSLRSLGKCLLNTYYVSDIL